MRFEKNRNMAQDLPGVARAMRPRRLGHTARTVSGVFAPDGSPLIRTARPEELAAVGELTVRVYVGDGLANPGYVETLRDAEGRAKAATVLVAVDPKADDLLGAVTLVTEGGAYAENADPGEAVVRMLAVDPPARQRGIGEALVRECMHRAKVHGCHRLVLSTQPEMTAAHRIYERLGFVRRPARDWSPIPGLDLLVYTYELG